MQNTGNFIHFYIVRFEASLKYVILPSYKNIVTQTSKVCKCLKHKKTEMETPFISKIY